MAELCECKHPKNYHNEVGCGGVVELRTSAIVNHAACKCKSYRPPAEPDATDEDFKIEPISQHTLKVPVQYKGQAEPLDFTEPDATERARAFFVKQGKWDLAERFDGWQCCELMTAFLESERPRIKAEAVREFVERVLCLYKSGHPNFSTIDKVIIQVAKEMTEEVK